VNRSRRLAPGRTWPCSPTDISSILVEVGAPEIEVIWFPTRSMPSRLEPRVGLVMEAKWKPHRTSIGSPGRGGASIWIRDVDSANCADVRDGLVTAALPEAAAWFASMPSRGDGWLALEHGIEWIWRGGTLRRHDAR
jgi:hypothetical protein